MGNGVGWANLLATNYMAATYQGKIIANVVDGQAPSAVATTQANVDDYISYNTPWSSILSLGVNGPALNALANEDGSDVTDYVNLSVVPGDALSSIVFEPKFYMK